MSGPSIKHVDPQTSSDEVEQILLTDGVVIIDNVITPTMVDQILSELDT